MCNRYSWTRITITFWYGETIYSFYMFRNRDFSSTKYARISLFVEIHMCLIIAYISTKVNVEIWFVTSCYVIKIDSF